MSLKHLYLDIKSLKCYPDIVISRVSDDGHYGPYMLVGTSNMSMNTHVFLYINGKVKVECKANRYNVNIKNRYGDIIFYKYYVHDGKEYISQYSMRIGDDVMRIPRLPTIEDITNNIDELNTSKNIVTLLLKDELKTFVP